MPGTTKKLILFLCLISTGSLQTTNAQTAAGVKLENPKGLPPTNSYSHVAAIDLGSSIMLIISGQVALDSTGKLVGAGDIEKQTRQVFANISTILNHYSGGMSHIVKVSYFLLNAEDIPGLRKVRNEVINLSAPPASTLLVVKQLAANGLLVEIEATAMIPKK